MFMLFGSSLKQFKTDPSILPPQTEPMPLHSNEIYITCFCHEHERYFRDVFHFYRPTSVMKMSMDPGVNFSHS